MMKDFILEMDLKNEKKKYHALNKIIPTIIELANKKYKYSEIKDKIEKPNINNPVEPYKI